MKRLNAVARLTFFLATIFAMVFLSQAEPRDKHVSTAQQKKPAAPEETFEPQARTAQPAAEPLALEAPQPVSIPGAWPFPMGNRP